jgi:4-phytase/acid phosphatase
MTAVSAVGGRKLGMGGPRRRPRLDIEGGCLDGNRLVRFHRDMGSVPEFGIRASRAFSRIAAILALVGCLYGPSVRDVRGDELKLAIVLTRHGVRSPLLSGEVMAAFAGQPWPKWETAPGIQTPHGNQLIALMGDYYRERFQKEGLLSGDPAVDGPAVFVRADNDERTKETGRILAKALVSVGDPDVHALPEGEIDPLFRAFAAHVGKPDPELASAAVLGRMGGDPSNVERAYATQLGELDGILFGPGGNPQQRPAGGEATRVSPGSKHYLVSLKGRLQTALDCTDSFILEYAEGMPLSDVGWGRVDAGKLADMLALHELYFDLTDRTFYPAQVEGSNLASHIIDTLEQAAAGDSVPGAIGPSGERVVILAGHDSNIANIGGLFSMNWWISGTQANPMLPGGALVFELWKRGDGPSPYYVRTSYIAQTLDQQREATVLSLGTPPGLSPIFVPGCSGQGPNFDAPLASFVRQARKVIDPAFIAPEL